MSENSLLTDETVAEIQSILRRDRSHYYTVPEYFEAIKEDAKEIINLIYPLAFAAGEQAGFNDAISWAGQLCFDHDGGYKRHIDCVQCVQEKRKEIKP